MKVSLFKIVNVSFLTLFFTFISTTGFYANAISISAYRIHLDTDNREESFVIFNQDVAPQECNLKLRHYNYDEDSNISAIPDENTPEHSAKDWIRFSPQQFILTPAHVQTVRFVMRRKANTAPAEYRSYLVIDCGVTHNIVEKKSDNIQSDEKPKVSVAPRLIHNVPIVVRTGALEANMTISDINIVNGAVKFTLNRTGNRSVYGDVALFDKKTGDKVSFQTGISIYTESSRLAISLGLGNYNADDLIIRFTENKLYGGTIEVEQSVKN